ncbi:hypothetical protein [Streptomyces sp.]|uniref:hypothetical protein n=1 Tax=Streptomyces sp. TaxID=1931 RepID=UPI002F42F6F7
MSPQLLTEPLSVYLNDHLTGSFAGGALALRMAGSHADSSRAAEMRRLAEEVVRDRDELVRIMDRLGVPVRHYRTWLGIAGERITRLKSNGTLLRRSPLSDLIELEAMRTGVEGKTALWQALLAIADDEPLLDQAELQRLEQRAHDQARTLKRWHRTVSADVLSRRGEQAAGFRGVSPAHR